MTIKDNGFPLFVLGLLLFCGCSASRINKIEDPSFSGNWIAVSKNHSAILGDMVISQNEIEFSKKGSIGFKIIHSNGTEYILKINRDIGEGFFVRIGPVSSSKHSRNVELEVAFFNSKEDAMKFKTDRVGDASSWGVYTRSPNDL